MGHPKPKDLHRFVDGELSERRARAIDSHLEGCSECNDAVERARGAGDLIRLAMREAIDEAPLEGLADGVMARLDEEQPPLPWTARLAAWFEEFVRYQRKVWVPPLAVAATAAVAAFIVFGFQEPQMTTGPPPAELPPGTTVLSVSFGNSVNGTVFELEDKDGSTTAVIWVDNAKSGSGSEENTGALRHSSPSATGVKHT